MSTWKLKKIFQSDVSSYFWFVAFQDCSTNIVLLRDCCSFDKLLILVIDVSAFHRENLSIAFYWIHSVFFFLKSIAFLLCLYCLSLVWYCFFANSKSIRCALRSLSYFWAFYLHITALVSVWDTDINRQKNLFLLGFFHIPPYLCWILTLCPCMDSSWQVSLSSLYISQRWTGRGQRGVEGIPSIEIRIQFLEAGL